MHILFIGYGKTSQRIAKHLFADGHQITAISRTSYDHEGVNHIQQDVHQLNLATLDPIDCVYILLSPQDRTLNGYQETYFNTTVPILRELKKHPVQRLIVVSSTRVYQGCVDLDINDDTPIQPNDAHGEVLQRMEQTYQQAFGEKCVIVRPSGIYGTSVQRMIKLAKETQTYCKTHWSNRIHIDDLAQGLAWLSSIEQTKQSYIMSDSTPYLLHETILWFQKRLNLPALTYVPTQVTGKKIIANRIKMNYQNCFEVYEDLLKRSQM